MKKLLFAIAGAAAFSAFAADPEAGANDISIVGFENYTVDQTVIGYGDNGVSGNSLWTCVGDDASLVKTLGGDNAPVPSITEPRPFDGETNTKYLALDTNGSELQRAIPAGGQTVAATGTYIDTLVQFTPSESAPTTNDLVGAKLAIWLGVDSVNNTTNLYVQGGYYDESGEVLSVTPQAYKLNKSCDPGTWYRLTVKAYATIGNAAATEGETTLPAFTIMIDGEEIATSDAVYSSDALVYLCPGEGDGNEEDNYIDAAELALLKAGKIIPSLDATMAAGTLTAVGFKGTGALDDFVVTTEAPEFGPAGIDFTLTWPAGLTAVSYQIGEGEPVAISDASPLAIQGLTGGETIKFIVQNADGAQKTLSATAADGEGIDATGTTFGWAEYLGDAVAGAYQIDDFADLDMLRKGVAAGLSTTGETFNQTANIDMSTAGPFAGIGSYAANLNSGVAFCGTYDGQGYKISNVDFTQRNYGGVFNQVKGGTIKNLTVENITCSTFDSAVNEGEWGCAIVGNAGLGATLQGLTAMGDFGTTARPCSHNVAGIAIRVCGGASNVVNGVTMLETLVKDCTNNATLHGFYTKAGGITALTQDQNGVPNDYALFDGCVNNSDIAMVEATGSTLSKIGRDGLSGILGYVADGTKIKDCVNNGTLTSALTTAKIGGIVGWAQGRTLDDLGGNKNPAAAKMVGDPAGSTITGFTYATVDNGVATTVTTLAKDGEYLLEGNAAPTFEFTAAGTIAFDTALGYTLDGTGITAGQGLKEFTSSTSGTVTTYTAVGYEVFTAVTLNTNALELTVGDTFTLVATTTPATAADDIITWSSDNAAIATVVDGLVTAVSTGTVTVTVVSTNDASVKATCEVTVKVPASSGWVDDPTDIPEDTTAADQYKELAGSDLANADAKELTVWAKAKTVEFSAVTAAPADYVEAFLLDCEPTPAAVAKEKEEFVLDISFDSEGKPVVSTPDGKMYNGKLQLKGKASLDDASWTPVNETSSSYKFYMYELSL